jgi:hypothetical protein
MFITWMNLKDIELGEISQSEKDKHLIILIMWGSRRSQIHKDQE